MKRQVTVKQSTKLNHHEITRCLLFLTPDKCYVRSSSKGAVKFSERNVRRSRQL